MPVITLHTEIQAPISRCFDLSRSIDLHTLSTAQTGEKAVAGRTSGLIGLHETVTWRARHFGIWQTLTSRITEYSYPDYFCDEMLQGAFRSIRHEHHFREIPLESEFSGTLMTDLFYFKAPLGWLGNLANHMFLNAYMKALLAERNRVIKAFAETDQWRQVLAE
jgi:ligand-binding SRPBCC domain-containing protein